MKRKCNMCDDSFKTSTSDVIAVLKRQQYKINESARKKVDAIEKKISELQKIDNDERASHYNVFVGKCYIHRYFSIGRITHARADLYKILEYSDEMFTVEHISIQIETSDIVIKSSKEGLNAAWLEKIITNSFEISEEDFEWYKKHDELIDKLNSYGK